MLPFCSACVKLGVTPLHHSSGHLFVQVPWGEGLPGEGSWGMQTTWLRSGRTAKLIMEGIRSLFNSSLAPLFWLVPKASRPSAKYCFPCWQCPCVRAHSRDICLAPSNNTQFKLMVSYQFPAHHCRTVSLLLQQLIYHF